MGVCLGLFLCLRNHLFLAFVFITVEQCYLFVVFHSASECKSDFAYTQSNSWRQPGCIWRWSHSIQGEQIRRADVKNNTQMQFRPFARITYFELKTEGLIIHKKIFSVAVNFEGKEYFDLIKVTRLCLFLGDGASFTILNTYMSC